METTYSKTFAMATFSNKVAGLNIACYFAEKSFPSRMCPVNSASSFRIAIDEQRFLHGPLKAHQKYVLLQNEVWCYRNDNLLLSIYAEQVVRSHNI